jgi:PHS family inorganic phosphate transporter-like MFS transporter
MNSLKSNALESSDETKLTRFHARMVITAGTGFFTDAYDLFVIGVVTSLLLPIWHLSTTQLALLNGASLAAAAVGAVCFGKLADIFGRKKIYGFEVLILFIGAILSAMSVNFTWLLISRIIVGFGIGGDYPISAVVASEHANRKNRGFLVLLVFAMQALGLIVGPLLASALLALHISPELTWRLLLGFGAIPAASVFYLRKTIQETPHYLLSQQNPYEVSRVVRDLVTGQNNNHRTDIQLQKHRLLSKKWLPCLFGTAGAWFLLDIAFYGNGISSVMILHTINPSGNLLQQTLLSTLMFFCFAVPGYLLAAKYVDSIGRKFLQNLGFIMMGICYALIAFIPNITQTLPLFILIFGISFFFVNFGPNTTTFLIPSEIYPASIRAGAHGFSAAIGKIGAFIGAFFLPILLESHGLQWTIGLMSIICFLGIITTSFVSEMKQASLFSTETVQE